MFLLILEITSACWRAVRDFSLWVFVRTSTILSGRRADSSEHLVSHSQHSHSHHLTHNNNSSSNNASICVNVSPLHLPHEDAESHSPDMAKARSPVALRTRDPALAKSSKGKGRKLQLSAEDPTQHQTAKQRRREKARAAAVSAGLAKSHSADKVKDRATGDQLDVAAAGAAVDDRAEEEEEEEVLSSLPPDFMCPVCLDMLREPMMPPCGHAFCESCILAANAMGKHECPICRAPFTESRLKPCSQIKRLMARCTLPMRCSCGDVLPVRNFPSHARRCAKVEEVSSLKFQPIAKTHHSPPPVAPNRVTFKCPLCETANLDVEGLCSHVRQRHPKAGRAVCPVCVSMPWGDPTYATANFARHLETRHKYDVSGFVDFEQDEEEMVRRALEASLHNS